MSIDQKTLDEYGQKYVVSMLGEQTLAEAFGKLEETGFDLNHTYLVVKQEGGAYQVILFSELIKLIDRGGSRILELLLSHLPLPAVDRVVSKDIDISGLTVVNWVKYHPESTVVVVDEHKDFVALFVNPTLSGGTKNLSSWMVTLLESFQYRNLKQLCLDAKVPGKVLLGRAFLLRVRVRIPTSTQFDEDGFKVDSENVIVNWPKNKSYVSLKVRIDAPECKISGNSSEAFRLFRNQDSHTLDFHLIPESLGKISIVVRLYQEEESFGSAMLHTVVLKQSIEIGELESTTTSYDFVESLPSALYKRLHEVLLRCRLFDSQEELKVVFVDQRIAPWRKLLPEASTPFVRVLKVIDLLHNSYNEAGENVLVLLLHVLLDLLDPHDHCSKEIAQLTNELEQRQRQLMATS
ncbi:MAG TPA: hypothetical protein PKH77_14785 [Anaerolineae bacterium]|nr:hypothetical protein [Anaerolineae bacterium]